MQYSVGDKVETRINKIQENGCFCSFLPLSKNQFGFMPNYLMPSCFDENGNITVKVGDTIIAVINKITDKGIILSDLQAFDKQRQQVLAQNFASYYELGTIFEAEVSKVESSRIIINLGNIKGIVKKKDTNWNEINRLEDLFFEGETINAVFINYKNDQLLFSTKHLKEKPYEDSLYNLSLDELLKFAGHNSNEFIGQVKKYYYGIFIENLYSNDNKNKGKLLIDPIYGYNLRAMVPNANFDVEENKFYKISLKLSPKDKRIERNQLFQFFATEFEETPNPYKRDVDITFEKFTSPAGNVATAHLLAEVGKNMYSLKDRMFFELIQNADDASSKQGVLIKVNSEGDYLIVRHNGNSFDKQDFEAITSAANGTKKANENKTGYKGIGFKSVFTDSDKVFIKTGGYQFKFDKNDERFRDFEKFYFLVNSLNTDEQKSSFLEKYNSEYNRFRGVADIPWQLEPIWINDFPKELGENFTSSNVAIALRLGKNKIEGKNGYIQAIDEIISNPKFMLFLRNTKRIDFNGKSVSKTTKGDIITLKNSFESNRVEDFKRVDFKVLVNNEVFEKNGIDIRIKIDKKDEVTERIIEAKFIDLHNQEVENIPKKIAINNTTTISFAVPIEEDGTLKPITKCNEISMFAFLPTLVKDFKFPFYINANFILDSPRQRILGDNPWNYYLMQEIARSLISWCASLNEKQEKNALNILITHYFDEETPDTKHLAEHFNAAYKSAIESETFILNHKGYLSKQEEIILDKSGLSEIVGADLFCELLKPDKLLPSDNIDSKVLSEDIFEKIETLKFDDIIGIITGNSAINNWYKFASEYQKQELYKWIDKNNTTAREEKLPDFVSSLPIFQFGEESKSLKDIESENYIVTTEHIIQSVLKTLIYLHSYYIVTTEHIIPIKDILAKLNFVCSDNVFEENHPLFDFIETQNEEDLFKLIKGSDFSNLDGTERYKLFCALKDFDGVGNAKLKEIALFKNVNGDFMPLSEMVAYRENAPVWLSKYILSEEDNNPNIYDYLISNNNEFSEVIQKHYEELYTSFGELYKVYRNEWTGKFTRDIIDSQQEIDNDILSIIEESDTLTKKYFLNSIKMLELRSTNTYKIDSYEYRVLQLALSIYNEPSDFSSKVYFDKKCIKDFSISDDVICEYEQNGETKKIKMSLAELLPQYQNQSDSIDTVKHLFESRKGLDKFFDVKPKSLNVVHTELNNYLDIPERSFSVWNVKGNAQQYLFATYYRRHKKNWNNLYVPKIDLDNETDEFVYELLDFLYHNDISIDESPFTYHLKKYFHEMHFDSDYIFEYEQLLPIIESWANDDKKKQYLTRNGVKETSCQALQFRQLFLKNDPIGFIDKLEEKELSSGIEFIATVKDINRPFTGNNQKTILLQLKDKKCCNLSDLWNEDKMEENSEELNTTEYNEWIENHYPQIFIYQGNLPCQLFFKDELLLNYEDSNYDYYYNKQSKKLFVGNTRKIEDILFEVAKKGESDFDFDDYKFIYLEGKISVSQEDIDKKDKTIISLSESNRKKDDIIERYRAKYGDLEDEGESKVIADTNNVINEFHLNAQNEIRSQSYLIEREGISKEEQIKAHEEAEQIVMEKLEADGYDCSNWIMKNLEIKSEYEKWQFINRVDNIISPDGEIINLIIKSAKGGYIYLSASDFEFLTSNSNNVLMVWDGNNVHSVTADEIFNKDSNVNLIFDTEYTPKHYYAALSKVFQYVKRTTFAVKNPRYNAYETIKSFGMDSKIEGIQELFDDNDL